VSTLHSVAALLQAADPNLPPVSSGVFFIATILKMLIIFRIATDPTELGRAGCSRQRMD
jgi:hypothetical protein